MPRRRVHVSREPGQRPRSVLREADAGTARGDRASHRCGHPPHPFAGRLHGGPREHLPSRGHGGVRPRDAELCHRSPHACRGPARHRVPRAAARQPRSPSGVCSGSAAGQCSIVCFTGRPRGQGASMLSLYTPQAMRLNNTVGLSSVACSKRRSPLPHDLLVKSSSSHAATGARRLAEIGVEPELQFRRSVTQAGTEVPAPHPQVLPHTVGHRYCSCAVPRPGAPPVTGFPSVSSSTISPSCSSRTPAWIFERSPTSSSVAASGLTYFFAAPSAWSSDAVVVASYPR